MVTYVNVIKTFDNIFNVYDNKKMCVKKYTIYYHKPNVSNGNDKK